MYLCLISLRFYKEVTPRVNKEAPCSYMHLFPLHATVKWTKRKTFIRIQVRQWDCAYEHKHNQTV